MATDVEIYDLVQSDGSEFLKRAAVRLHKLSRDVVNESVGTPNHANRLLWAAEVAADPMDMARTMRWDLMANTDVYAAEEPGSTSDDSWRSAKIEAAASGLIDSYATGV